jgi:hypothetical protein
MVCCSRGTTASVIGMSRARPQRRVPRPAPVGQLRGAATDRYQDQCLQNSSHGSHGSTRNPGRQDSTLLPRRAWNLRAADGSCPARQRTASAAWACYWPSSGASLLGIRPAFRSGAGMPGPASRYFGGDGLWGAWPDREFAAQRSDVLLAEPVAENSWSAMRSSCIPASAKSSVVRPGAHLVHSSRTRRRPTDRSSSPSARLRLAP